MFHWLSTAFSTYLLHTEHGNGYQWWSSGPGPGLGQITLLLAPLAWFHHKNCHHAGCWSIKTHIHPDHGWPSCRAHWDETPDHIRS